MIYESMNKSEIDDLGGIVKNMKKYEVELIILKMENVGMKGN